MQATTEYVEKFLEVVNQPEWASEERWPQIWSFCEDTNEYTFETTAPDPYEMLPNVVELVKVMEVDTFFIMTGWMSKIDEETKEAEDDTRVRVRVILGASPKCDPFVAVQRAGENVEIFDDIGEGMFPDTFHALMSDN